VSRPGNLSIKSGDGLATNKKPAVDSQGGFLGLAIVLRASKLKKNQIGT